MCIRMVAGNSRRATELRNIAIGVGIRAVSLFIDLFARGFRRVL